MTKGRNGDEKIIFKVGTDGVRKNLGLRKFQPGYMSNQIQILMVLV